MNKRLSALLVFVATVSLVVTSCQQAQPVPDANAAFQTAVASQVARDFELMTLTAVGYTPTPAPTQTPAIVIQTVVVTPTPVPTATLIPVSGKPDCNDPDVVEFLKNNYDALNPNPPNLKFNKVMKEGLSHFNYKTNGDLIGIDREGLDADKDKMKRLLDEVQEVWAPPSLVQFQQQEVNYLRNLWLAFWKGWQHYEGHEGDAQEFKMNADYWRTVLDASPVNQCGYRIFDP